ncbi:DsbA family oxidoreductase [Sphingobacterium hungaricum]|uniref:Disulfide bond formation protein DsbA n=1 Tax=Sphingobacterium hungaricum TaxID=2082723 RepID=A0A928UXM6_9SPHI|nr:DsbA family oxidoreductase [Sphingobacterium hungaricum]MBE8715156.1 disulfide bond formation protein DsbA [Sphingobacterium hungaricum]
MQKNQLKIEVWSDVMCPFCYIGKRKIEQALADFPDREQVAIEWKSYQLNPNLVTDTTISTAEFLAKHKGISTEQAEEMNQYVSDMASKVGLEFNFKQAVVANSFQAHAFSHFAKASGKQNEAEELLFKAYFTEGKNIDDVEVLATMAEELGLNKEDLLKALAENTYADAVKEDILESQQIGVRGVPFFVFDRKYAISGAQEAQVFEDTLHKTFTEWKKKQPSLTIIEGESCGPDGCD